MLSPPPPAAASAPSGASSPTPAACQYALPCTIGPVPLSSNPTQGWTSGGLRVAPSRRGSALPPWARLDVRLPCATLDNGRSCNELPPAPLRDRSSAQSPTRCDTLAERPAASDGRGAAAAAGLAPAVCVWATRRSVSLAVPPAAAAAGGAGNHGVGANSGLPGPARPRHPVHVLAQTAAVCQRSGLRMRVAAAWACRPTEAIGSGAAVDGFHAGRAVHRRSKLVRGSRRRRRTCQQLCWAGRWWRRRRGGAIAVCVARLSANAGYVCGVRVKIARASVSIGYICSVCICARDGATAGAQARNPASITILVWRR
eukprot:352455-Chlamydomonas_euryale.AAC.2